MSSALQQHPGAFMVTGSAKRLGKALCTELASKGWPLILHYRTSLDEIHDTRLICEKALRDVGAQAQVDIIQGDFSSESKICYFLDEVEDRFCDCLYGVVNNVGNYFWETASKTGLSRSRELFLVNFHAPCEIMRRTSHIMKKRALGGRIINIGSCGINRQSADTFSPMYSASKSALFHLTKSFAKELAPDRISVNMVSPGKLTNSIDNNLTHHFIPFGRQGESDEIARVIAFLSERASEYITGQNIEVSGAFCL